MQTCAAFPREVYFLAHLTGLPCMSPAFAVGSRDGGLELS